MLGVGRHDIQNEGLLGVEHALESSSQIFLVDHSLGRNSEALADPDIVRIDAVEIFGIPEEGMATIALMKAVLPLHHHAKVLVIKNNHFGGNALDMCCSQLLNIHEERAVTINVDHLLVWSSQLGTQSGGIAIAHRA